MDFVAGRATIIPFFLLNLSFLYQHDAFITSGQEVTNPAEKIDDKEGEEAKALEGKTEAAPST